MTAPSMPPAQRGDGGWWAFGPLDDGTVGWVWLADPKPDGFAPWRGTVRLALTGILCFEVGYAAYSFAEAERIDQVIGGSFLRPGEVSSEVEFWLGAGVIGMVIGGAMHGWALITAIGKLRG